MKRFIYISFLFLFCAESSAQNSFYQSYTSTNRDDGGVELTENLKRELIIFGLTSFNGDPVKFLKVDSLGSQVYQNHYSLLFNTVNGGDKYNDSIYFSYGSLYNPIEGAANSFILFVKEENGDSLKTLDVNFAFNDRIHDVIVTPDSNFVVMGFYTDTLATDIMPYVAKIDSNGSILWFKTHNVGGIQETINNIQATLDGGYIIGGVEEETPGGHLDLFLLKLDSLGNQQWKFLYNEPLSQKIGHVEVLADGNYALFGTGYHPNGAQRAILKIDANGGLIWRRKHGFIQFDEGYIVGRELPNGNFICAGTSVRIYNNQLIDDVNLSMLDTAGNVLWTKDFNYHGMDINEYVKDLIVTSDGGYAMTGFILNAPNNQGNDVFVLKTDANGIITGLHSGFKEVTLANRIYPNPTRDVVNIPAIPKLQSIEVYDLGGKLMSAELFSRDFGTNSASSNSFSLQEKSTEVFKGSNHQLDLSNYLPGIYFIKIILRDGSFQTVKVVKE